MADGPLSIGRRIARSSRKFPLPITTRCRIPAARHYRPGAGMPGALRHPLHSCGRRACHRIHSLPTRCDASWWGRWGVNYVYGTWQVLVGLQAIGQDMNAEFLCRAANWLRNVQKPDGSWGETCESYDDVSLKGTGVSTPSQTAWGAMGLMAAFGGNDPAVKKAINWLVKHQTSDGSWEENHYTERASPKSFISSTTCTGSIFP